MMGSGGGVVVLVYFVVIGVILLRLLVLLRISDLGSSARVARRSGAVAMAAIKRQPAMRFVRREYLLNGTS